MNRKAFIQKISFVGVGLSLTPWKLASGKPPIQTFALPRATVHIPHGNFAAADLEKLTVREFDLACTVQQFMRNGIEPNSDDLKVFSFDSGQEQFTICLTRNGMSFSEGEFSSLKISVDSFDDSYFSISER